MKSIIDNQEKWVKEHYIPCSRGYLSCYQDNLFISLDGKDLENFEKGGGNELEDKNGEKAKMKALKSSSALCVNFFLYLKRKGLLPTLLKSIGLHSASIIDGEFEKKLNTGVSPAPANLDFYIDCENCAIGIESKFTEHYDKHHAPLKQSYLDENDEWHLKAKCYKSFPYLAQWINNKWEIGKYSAKGKTYTGRFSPFEYLDVEQLVKHLFALNNNKKPYYLIYLHYDIVCDEITKHEEEISEFCSILKKDRVNFISISYQSLFAKLKKELLAHTEYSSYMESRYLL